MVGGVAINILCTQGRHIQYRDVRKKQGSRRHIYSILFHCHPSVHALHSFSSSSDMLLLVLLPPLVLLFKLVLVLFISFLGLDLSFIDIGVAGFWVKLASSSCFFVGN